MARYTVRLSVKGARMIPHQLVCTCALTEYTSRPSCDTSAPLFPKADYNCVFQFRALFWLTVHQGGSVYRGATPYRLVGDGSGESLDESLLFHLIGHQNPLKFIDVEVVFDIVAPHLTWGDLTPSRCSRPPQKKAAGIDPVNSRGFYLEGRFCTAHFKA
jgi:hypothetical protein